MKHFNGELDYIFFFYGFAFLLLAAVCFLLARDKSRRAWRWLALFGLAHGLNEWLDLLAFTFSDNTVFLSLRLLVMSLSFIFLLEFARRLGRAAGGGFSPLVYAVLLPLGSLGAICGYPGLNAGLRYALGLSGGLLAALAVYRASTRADAPQRRPLLLICCGLGLYALAAGAVVPYADFIPARWLNQTAFAAAFAFPVQLLRAVLAAIIAAGAWLYYLKCGAPQTAGTTAERKIRIAAVLTGALLLTMGAGWVITSLMGTRAAGDLVRDSENMEDIIHNRLQDSIRTADQAVTALAGSPGITGTTDLAKSESVLDRYCGAYGFAVCYLMDLRGVVTVSSNRNTPESFVGKSYAFRPYFKAAAAGATGNYFALGITSRERGYYASAPVRSPGGRVTGVVVIKRNINFLGRELRLLPYAFLVSPEGIIFLSSKPELLFKSFWPVSEAERSELAQSRQFGRLEFSPLFGEEPEDEDFIDYGGEKYYISRSYLAQKGWSVISFNSTRPVRMARFAGILLTLTFCVMLLAFFIALNISESAREAAEVLLKLKEEVRTLSGIVPICASCKKVRDDKGYWAKVETYVAAHTEAKFSHGLCPACAKKLYPDYSENEKDTDKS